MADAGNPRCPCGRPTRPRSDAGGLCYRCRGRRTRLDALTPAEVADICGVSVTTVRSMVEKAGLPCYRLPACRHRRFRRDALVRWLEENGMPEEMVARARGGAG